MHLFVKVIQMVDVIFVSAYIFYRPSIYRSFLTEDNSILSKIKMIIYFSFFTILGNYIGVNNFTHTLDEASNYNMIVTISPIYVILAGYTGGPVIGLIIGIISAIHRYFSHEFSPRLVWRRSGSTC
jgi:two-component system LytT family sensor kinase